MDKVASFKLDPKLYKKICDLDPSGRKKFTAGIYFLINHYFKKDNK